HPCDHQSPGFLSISSDRRAVHSWSRISSAGHNVLLDALKIFSPMSRDLSNTEELVSFLQELSEEGHKPSVLRSQDVYRYRSCTSQPLTEDMLKLASKNVRPTTKKRKRKPQIKKREVHPSWNMSERSSPRIQGIRPPEMLVNHHAMVYSRTPSRTVELSQVDLQPCLRLTNIEGLSGFHTARLQIQTVWDSEMSSVTFPPQPHPPTLSGIPSQPSQNGDGASTRAVALFSQKNLSCPIRLDGALIGDSAPVFYANVGVALGEGALQKKAKLELKLFTKCSFCSIHPTDKQKMFHVLKMGVTKLTCEKTADWRFNVF
uniref:Coiled-coil domain containing 71 n=1 Tax=Kryptolebias marmoratus TaxID=37003 RepID=A0A3Q3BBX2_KRYMA